MARSKFIPPSPIVVIYDFETGGLDPAEGAEPIEIAAIAIDTRIRPAFPEVARFPARTMRVKHPENIHSQALQTNGITMERILAGEDPKLVFQDFLNWCGKVTGSRHGTVRTMLGGHNVQFDIRFLKWALKEYLPHEDFEKHFDYHAMDSHPVFHFRHCLVSKRSQFSNLVRATKMYGISHAAHEAMGDVEATVEILRRMAAEELNLDKYKQLASALPHILYGSGNLNMTELESLVRQVFPTTNLDDESTYPQVFTEVN